MASACRITSRGISTTAIREGAKNFRKFYLANKAGNREEKLQRAKDPNAVIDLRGLRLTGYRKGNKYIHINEMTPEIIVPNLEGFKLKPYVTYQSVNVKCREFRAKDLFEVIYGEKIRKDFKEGALKPNGDPVNPSEYESLTPEEAKIRAAQTGTDIFTEEPKPEDVKRL